MGDGVSSAPTDLRNASAAPSTRWTGGALGGDPQPLTVLIYDPIREIDWDYECERRALGSYDIDLVVPETELASEDQLRAADVIVTLRPLPIGLVPTLARCVGILCYRVGMDGVDLAEADRCGIAVANVAGYCTDEVADHAMALLLAVQRRLVPFASAAAAGDWHVHRRPELGDIRRLRGQTAGIVGVGRIGTQVARRAMAFGMTVIGHDPYLVQSPSRDVALVSMDDLLARSDVVVLCTSLNAGSRQLMDGARIRTMRKRSTLINVARGGLIDEVALGDALISGHLAAAALDIRSSEPPDRYNDPLAGLPKVILTQNLAETSRESHSDLHALAARSVLELLVASGRLTADRIHLTSSKEST